MQSRSDRAKVIPLWVTFGGVAVAAIAYQVGGIVALAIAFAFISAAGLLLGGRFRQFASVGFVIAGVALAIFLISALL